MDRVPAWMEQWNMWPERGGTILCAVSGGKDSMAMLCCLRKLGQSHGVQIVAAHYHHGIRGETADRDAAFVEDFCRQQEIPCAVGRGDVPTFAAQEGLSMEEAGRKLRYAFWNRRRIHWERIRSLRHIMRGTMRRPYCSNCFGAAAAKGSVGSHRCGAG